MRRAALVLALTPSLLLADGDWLYRAPPDPAPLAARDSGAEQDTGIETPAGRLATSARSLSAWKNQAAWLARQLGTGGLRVGAPVHIRIFKQSRELDLYLEQGNRFVRYRTYPICDVSGTLGPKRFEGDFQAPEGFYSVVPGRMHPGSDFHLAFNLGYPNAHDRAQQRTGSNIMVHGGCASNGCFAMSDYYMEQIYLLAEAAFRNGQEEIGVEIYPFRMSAANLEAHRANRWFPFWQRLKPLHDHFIEHGTPPHVVPGRDGYRLAGSAGGDTPPVTAP